MEILRKLAQLAGTDRTAIVYGDGTLSYRTLDHWSDAFAAYLKREAPDGKAPVLIYGHKELEIPACMFGSLKAGRGYVPVDVTYPPERVAQIAAEEEKMKKAIALLVALAICAALCACGNRQKTLEETDLSMSVNGVEVTTKSSVDTLLTIFDGKYETAEAVSCVYSGMERTYSNETLSVFTYPGDDGAEHLMEAYAQANVQTARGITIGSSLKDVEDAYGSDYTRNGNVVSFELPASNDQMVPAGIYFELYDDMVIAIGIVCEHRAQ